MSPMVAWTSTIRPPAPSPWTARKAISSVIEPARPHRPSRAGTAPPRSAEHAFAPADRPACHRAASPRFGPADRRWSPTRAAPDLPRSPTIVGSAVATIVESSAASSITSIRPAKIRPTAGAGVPERGAAGSPQACSTRPAGLVRGACSPPAAVRTDGEGSRRCRCGRRSRRSGSPHRRSPCPGR